MRTQITIHRQGSWLQLLQQHRIIGVIRAPELEIGLNLAQTIAAAGISLIEITANSDRPTQLIETLVETLPHCTIGAGTVTGVDQLHNLVEAGAKFIFSPHTDINLIEAGIRANVAVVPGALTPTEIMQAAAAGASSVKVFPISAVGGANYIKSIKTAIGDIPLIPTGGVTRKNARSMIDAGAVAVGMAGDLFPACAVATKDWQLIGQRVRQCLAHLEEATGARE